MVEAVMEREETTLEKERAKLMGFTKENLLEIALNMSLIKDDANKDAPLLVSSTKSQITEAILEKTNQMTEAVAPVAEAGEELPPAIEPEKAEESDEIEGEAEYLTRIKHLMFTVGEKFAPDLGLVDVQFLDQEIDSWFERGYDVIYFDAVGFHPDGHRLLWVLEKTDKPEYTESKHIIRTLTAAPDAIRKTITGFQADAYISYLMENEDWNLVGVRYNGDDAAGAGLFMVWMLAK